jgi:formylglycine-generating enzyme required for sulfatase activity
VPVAAVVVAVAVLLLGGAVVAAYFVVPKIIAAVTGPGTEVTPTPTATPPASPEPSPTPGDTPFKPDLVALPAGSYQMGRTEVPPISDQHDNKYLLWVYSQWPAHPVTVGAFEIDKTEVTNAEYAAFLRDTGNAAPPGWNGNTPPAGAEQLPVSNVSYYEAVRFAAWRSGRDKTPYRLPTEEEWEYAARGGESARMYPWGDAWEAGRANMNASEPKPVGSFPQGRTAQGLDDMIGNVWEWTSTTAAMYQGNNRTELRAADRNKLVVRGGSYESTHDGSEPVTLTSRRWVERNFRSPVLGFRLVRAERAGG